MGLLNDYSNRIGFYFLKKLIFIIAINICIFFILLFSVEIVSRILIPQKNIHPIFNDEQLRTRGRSFIEANELRGFALKPGFSNAIYNINQKGFRGEEFPPSFRGKKQILILGESTTFGWGVKDNETYPFYLMGHFFEKDKAYVVNGGVPSYTSSQVLEYLKEIIAKGELAPDIILINSLWNDIWYSTITNWHPNILIYQKPPVWISWITDHSRFVYGMVMGFTKETNRTNIFNQKALSQYQKNIRQMILECQKKGILLAFVEPPFDADHMPETGLNEFHVRYTKAFFISMAELYLKSMRSIAKEYEIPVIAHGLDIRNLHQKSLFLDTLHPTAQGNALMALDIFNNLAPFFQYRSGKKE